MTPVASTNIKYSSQTVGKSFIKIMRDQTEELLEKAISIADWQLGMVTAKRPNENSSFLTPFKKQIILDAFKGDQLSIDAIYFSGENPFIYFKRLSSFDPELVSELHRKIWNEGRTPLLAIVTPGEIRLYDCFDTPEKKNLAKLQRGFFRDTEDDLNKLGSLLHQSKIDSGIIWEEHLGGSIKTDNRVDRKLVQNLIAARKKLFDEYKIPFAIIHDLLGRSLFTLYLEDRQILTPDNYPSRPEGVNNFFDLLDYPKSAYKLFYYLKDKFNGDLFPVTERENKIVGKKYSCLKIVKECFFGDEIATQQLALWRMFQFQFIPIELISSIYEEFMSEEDEQHKKIKKEGAFYTPQMLVELVLNEVLPWPDVNDSRYDLKILDPACGSGIFLVESYKRLIARWKYANKNENISENILEKLLLDNIFGIEKDTEAIKITAFSLYLIFLNNIEPKKVLSRDVRFKPLIRWGDRKELKRHKNKKSGNNLFQFSTFALPLDVRKNKFDLVVGNPPWKHGKPSSDVKKYLSNHRLPQQIICAYLHFMPDFAPEGVVSLIIAAKVLFNTGKIYENFRNSFFTKNNVEVIVNLSVIRDIVFTNASSPGAVIVYKKRSSVSNEKRKDYVTYCVPKSVEVVKRRQSVVVDASEIKFLPLREILKKDSKIFKIGMWGNVRDLKLIEKIKKIKSIKEYISDKEWGGGLIKDALARKGNRNLSRYPLLATNKIEKYFTPVKGSPVLGKDHKNYRTNTKKIFDPPIVIIKEGTKDSEFCCSYLTSRTAFLSSVFGISVRNKNVKFHKTLVACLNSSLASYFYFITSSSWGVDKGGRIQFNDALSFPGLPWKMQKNAIDQLAEKVDEIIEMRNSINLVTDWVEKLTAIQKEIDKIIYKEFEFSLSEISLIDDVLNYSSVLHNRYIKSGAEGFANIERDIVPYAEMMLSIINSTLNRIDKGVWIEVISSKGIKDPLIVIALNLNNYESYGTCKISQNENISQLLRDINTKIYEQYSESVFYRKVVKYYTDSKIYFIKPNQKRFWSISQAMNDADGVLLDLMKQ